MMPKTLLERIEEFERDPVAVSMLNHRRLTLDLASAYQSLLAEREANQQERVRLEGQVAGLKTWWMVQNYTESDYWKCDRHVPRGWHDFCGPFESEQNAIEGFAALDGKPGYRLVKKTYGEVVVQTSEAALAAGAKRWN